MIITIETTSGVKVSAPTEKWLIAVLLSISETEPERMVKIFQMVSDENIVQPFESVPESLLESASRPLQKR